LLLKKGNYREEAETSYDVYKMLERQANKNDSKRKDPCIRDITVGTADEGGQFRNICMEGCFLGRWE
jgi:hypothetical protein